MARWLLCAVEALHSHILWLHCLEHLQWTLYHLRKMTSNNFISSVTWARSTTFGNMYLLKLDESPATPQVVQGCMDEQMLCDFSYFILDEYMTKKYLWENKLIYVCVYIYIYIYKITFKQLDFLFTISCVFVSVSPKNSFSLDAFPPRQIQGVE